MTETPGLTKMQEKAGKHWFKKLAQAVVQLLCRS